MKQLQRPLWTKGVLLTPQHLQVQDRFLEELLSFHLSALTFRPWGLLHLEIDRQALEGGSIAVAAAAGILPDGMAFEMPGADPLPPPRPLGESDWSNDRESLDVFLAVPEHRPGGRNVSLGAGDRGTRYVAEILLRRDENTGQTEKPIQIARKNVRLLTDADPLEGHVLLPIARVKRGSAGEVEIDPQLVPPVLDIGASERLMGIARRAVEILTAKSAALSGTRRERGQGLADFGVSDVANFWLLYTMNTHLPRLRHLYETRRGHPAELFDALLALGGALTTFSTSVHAGSFPAYEHQDLGACFGRLDAMVRELLETVVPAHHVALPLKEVEPSVHATAVDQDRYLSGTHAYLAVAASVKRDDLVRKVPQLLKVGSADQVQRLIRQALPGVSLRHVPTPPGQLPVKLDYQYFQLERTGEEWDAIARSRNLAVYVPKDFPEPRLELVILLSRER
jgi:type VI secretion system protein ImpJ